MRTNIRSGVLGFGYWGANVARSFSKIPGCQLVSICDKDSAMIERARQDYPNAQASTKTKRCRSMMALAA